MNYHSESAKSGLKVGDRVFVTRIAVDLEMGWGNSWPPFMDRYVNKIHKIIREDSGSGFTLSPIDNERTYQFPYFVLKKVYKSSCKHRK